MSEKKTTLLIREPSIILTPTRTAKTCEEICKFVRTNYRISLYIHFRWFFVRWFWTCRACHRRRCRERVFNIVLFAVLMLTVCGETSPSYRYIKFTIYFQNTTVPCARYALRWERKKCGDAVEEKCFCCAFSRTGQEMACGGMIWWWHRVDDVKLRWRKGQTTRQWV